MQASDNNKAINIEEKKNKYDGKTLGWIEIVIFLLSTLGIVVLMSRIMDPKRLGIIDEISINDRYVVEASVEEEPIDVLVIGDSEAMVLLSPKKMMDDKGISSFVAGQYGMRISEAYYAIKDIIANQDPSVILLETNMLVLDSSEIYEANMTFNALVQHEFPIVKYHGMWKQELGLTKPELPEHFRGFETRDVIAPYTGDEYMIPSDESLNFYKSTDYYMDKICELCKEEGITLILVSSTSPTNFNYAKHNALQAMADSKGISYIDLNLVTDEMGIDWQTDELDGGDHVNISGTIKQTDYIEKYLSEHFDLPDRRGDN